jgi:isopropylmalate/homocitrate/citramalate synthase
MVKISPKQRRIVKAKIKGKSNKEIAQVEYPNATPDSQTVLVSRELNKPNVAQYYEQSKMIALKEHNITWSRVIKPISEALEATKQNNFTGEVTIDHNTRLSASKAARELLEVKQVSPEDKLPLMDKLPDGIDEIQLVRLMKK